jgi:hypothetical protein
VDNGDTSDLHGFTLYQLKGGPRFNLDRVKVLEIASRKPIPGGVSRCDGTYVLRFRTYPRNPEKDAERRELADAVAEKHGLQVREIEVSETLADTWDLK